MQMYLFSSDIFASAVGISLIPRPEYDPKPVPWCN